MKKPDWTEKTIEYSFVRLFPELYAMPLSGTPEIAGDGIFFNKKYVIIEFKRGKEQSKELNKEIKKYTENISYVSKELNNFYEHNTNAKNGHIIVFGYINFRSKAYSLCQKALIKIFNLNGFEGSSYDGFLKCMTYIDFITNNNKYKDVKYINKSELIQNNLVMNFNELKDYIKKISELKKPIYENSNNISNDTDKIRENIENMLIIGIDTKIHDTQSNQFSIERVDLNLILDFIEKSEFFEFENNKLKINDGINKVGLVKTNFLKNDKLNINQRISKGKKELLYKANRLINKINRLNYQKSNFSDYRKSIQSYLYFMKNVYDKNLTTYNKELVMNFYFLVRFKIHIIQKILHIHDNMNLTLFNDKDFHNINIYLLPISIFLIMNKKIEKENLKEIKLLFEDISKDINIMYGDIFIQDFFNEVTNKYLEADKVFDSLFMKCWCLLDNYDNYTKFKSNNILFFIKQYRYSLFEVFSKWENDTSDIHNIVEQLYQKIFNINEIKYFLTEFIEKN